jgi:hypothetical protein
MQESSIDAGVPMPREQSVRRGTGDQPLDDPGADNLPSREATTGVRSPPPTSLVIPTAGRRPGSDRGAAVRPRTVTGAVFAGLPNPLDPARPTRRQNRGRR